ncbi:MAG: hypothetical protein H0U76_29255 [Ktedonobacteraceae bacterium]|nr:hypothetical protein [Ktedonobacteraceae bacterium]
MNEQSDVVNMLTIAMKSCPSLVLPTLARAINHIKDLERQIKAYELAAKIHQEKKEVSL